MSGKGKAGIICGLLGMILTVTVTVFSVYFVLTNDTARMYLNQYFKYYTGDQEADIEETLDDLFSSFGLSSDLSSEEDTFSSQELDASDSAIPDGSDFPNHAQAPEDCTLQEKGVYL